MNNHGANFQCNKCGLAIDDVSVSCEHRVVGEGMDVIGGVERYHIECAGRKIEELREILAELCRQMFSVKEKEKAIELLELGYTYPSIVKMTSFSLEQLEKIHQEWYQ